MSVEIDPAELGFHRPFTVEVSQILKIKNPNSSPVAFKVKTTAPKQYCVRPNSGRIEPGHDVEVSVLLQAMKQEPPLDARCRDKFLVQSVTITGDKEFTNVTQIWEGVDKSAVQEKKIRVNWLAPQGDAPATGAVATPIRHSLANGVESTPEVPPPAYSSPGDLTQLASTPGHGAVKPEDSQEDIKREFENAPTTISGTTAATIKSAAEATYEELKEQLAKAQATIASLRDDASSGLRQRKAAAPDSDEKPVTQQLAQVARQGTEGVSVQIVAFLCLSSFLLAYFFF